MIERSENLLRKLSLFSFRDVSGIWFRVQGFGVYGVGKKALIRLKLEGFRTWPAETTTT